MSDSIHSAGVKPDDVHHFYKDFSFDKYVGLETKIAWRAKIV